MDQQQYEKTVITQQGGDAALHSSSEQKNQATSYTHTQVSAPVITVPSPIISSGAAGLADQIVGQGFSASAARISGTSVDVAVAETAEMRQKSAEDQARYHREQDAIVRAHEKVD